jgi:ABC-type transporter Mla maintaining outer membrane lipid asymmetry ATPase subunit MlaF
MPLIEARDITKAYGGLRPLRLKSLDVAPGEVVAISGPDVPAAAVLTDLLTGTVLPDTGSVRIAGHSTAEIAGQDEWLVFLEQFGIVNDRVVLLDELTVAANLAVPLTLEIDPLSSTTLARVVELAAEIGLDSSSLDRRLAEVRPVERWRVGLGRAIAHAPRILLVEHPTSSLAEEPDVVAAASAVRAVSESRSLATLIVTADATFSRMAATRRLEWRAATGGLREGDRWRNWFS